MFILHIALQGCLRASNVPYGLTPDTGGHIKYLLELAQAVASQPGVESQQIIVRRFDDPQLGSIYGGSEERLCEGVDIVRIDGASTAYVSKEDMHHELDALADSLEAHLRGLDHLPDIIHGHYADAGWLAAEMKERLGIPYVFTGHSLGRVKRLVVSEPGVPDGLDTRIAIEDRAVANADRIIASSLDEAELQYGLYDAAPTEMIRVIPPGCDLDSFRAERNVPHSLQADIGRFLEDPDKPCVLAVSRPVAKKNLAGLVHAYGQSPALQAAANLVIFAGTRTELAKEAHEPRAVLRELLELVDLYDLWGKVALPKQHESEDVPHIYRYAVDRRGVFVNPALNEPFGLTIIEAATAGLPTIATDSGGPNDILGRCRHGRLVDPLNTVAISSALLHHLQDSKAWDAAARSGRDNSSYYSWDRHACDYVLDAFQLSISAPGKLGHSPAVLTMVGMVEERAKRSLLVCDIDETLTGDPNGLEKLRNWMARQADCVFGVATGRSLHSALDVLQEWSLPVPSFLITSVGSELYWSMDGSTRRLRRDRNWPQIEADDWPHIEIDDLVAGLQGIDRQPHREQRQFKRSYFCQSPCDADRVRDALEARDVSCELVYSHGRFLDLLPEGVTKGHAVAYVAKALGVAMEDVMAAGDSGNDLHMLGMVGRPIVVANRTRELDELVQRSDVYVAQSGNAGGVLEGVHHYIGTDQRP